MMLGADRGGLEVITTWYKGGDKEVVTADITKVEELLEDKERLHRHLGQTGSTTPPWELRNQNNIRRGGSSNWSSACSGPWTSPWYAPPPSKFTTRWPLGQLSTEQRPEMGTHPVDESEKNKFPTCFNKHMIEKICIPWAKERFGIVKDAEAATKIINGFAGTMTKKRENHPQKASCVSSPNSIPPPYTGDIETGPATVTPDLAQSSTPYDAFVSYFNNNAALQSYMDLTHIEKVDDNKSVAWTEVSAIINRTKKHSTSYPSSRCASINCRRSYLRTSIKQSSHLYPATLTNILQNTKPQRKRVLKNI